MRCFISVWPLGDGWAVCADVIANPMVFEKGAIAESAARQLATSLCRAGMAVEVAIWLRDGSRACRMVLAPKDCTSAELLIAPAPSAQAPRCLADPMSGSRLESPGETSWVAARKGPA